MKPIKSMSAYKAQEIRDICSKLKISVMKTATKYKTKKELYSLICEKILFQINDSNIQLRSGKPIFKNPLQNKLEKYL